jgi:hypothetical protein
MVQQSMPRPAKIIIAILIRVRSLARRGVDLRVHRERFQMMHDLVKRAITIVIDT